MVERLGNIIMRLKNSFVKYVCFFWVLVVLNFFRKGGKGSVYLFIFYSLYSFFLF